MDIRGYIAKHPPFEKKTGKDKTLKMFLSYIRNLVILDVMGIAGFIMLDPTQAFAFLGALLLIMAAFGIYSLLSLRIRRIEERIECGRAI